jgi:diacylglycerol O-acyltransferase / wax synthase
MQCHYKIYCQAGDSLAIAYANRRNTLITTLSPADSIFFYTESRTQYQHTMGIIVLDPSDAPDDFDVDTLIAKSEDLVDEVPSFRLKAVDSPATMNVPMLAEDPDFNFYNHVHHIALPAPGSMEQLSELVGDIASRELNHDIPLWENWYVSGLEGGLVAIVSKTHHSMMDGVNGAETMAKMFDLEPNPPKREVAKHVSSSKRVEEPKTLDILQAAIKSRRKSPTVVKTMGKAVRGFMKRREVNKNFEHPELLPGNTMKGPKVFFNGQISTLRSMAMGSLSLTETKAIKNAFGVTLNDAILATVAIAVRKYLELHDDLPEEALSCMVPISLSLNTEAGETRDDEAANQVDTMNVKFPVQIQDPVELIQTLHKCSNASKQLFNDTYDNLVLTVMDTLPPTLAAPAMSFMTGDFSARFPISNLGVSNIPGPPFPLYMQGAKVVGNYPMGPIPNGIGLGITMMSYLDEIYFTVQGCREKTPDIAKLADFLNEALAELSEAAQEHAAATPEAPTPKRRKAARKPASTRKTKAAPKRKPRTKAASAAAKKTTPQKKGTKR